MRNLFLALLLANLLFAGWRLWIAPPEVPSRQLKAAGREAELRVVAAPQAAAPEGAASDRAAAAVASSEPVGPAAAAPGAGDAASCSRLGPIDDGQFADTLRATLAARGLRATTVVEAGQVWVGHWVQLESVPTREAADRMVARLAEGGLPDAYVFQSQPPFSVSLGVFREKERADRVAAAAAALGFHPEVTDRYRSGAQYWLFLQAAPEALQLGDLAREAGPEPKVQPVPCSAMPVGVTPPIN